MPHSDSFSDQEYAPLIEDDERLMFDVSNSEGSAIPGRHSGFWDFLKRPAALVVITWIVMACLLALDMLR